MQRIVKILFLLVITLHGIDVLADRVCEREEKQRLKNLASKVEFTYGYDLEKLVVNGREVENANFYITATNLNSDLKVTIMDDYFMDIYQEFKDGDNKEATLRGFKTGEKVVVTIYGFVPNACSGEEILKKVIRLPYYNTLKDDPKCEEYPDFKYCSDLLDESIKKDTFDAELKRYIAKEQKENPDIIDENNSHLLVIIVSIVSGCIVVGTIIMYVIYRRKKYSL